MQNRPSSRSLLPGGGRATPPPRTTSPAKPPRRVPEVKQSLTSAARERLSQRSPTPTQGRNSSPSAANVSQSPSTPNRERFHRSTSGSIRDTKVSSSHGNASGQKPLPSANNTLLTFETMARSTSPSTSSVSMSSIARSAPRTSLTPAEITELVRKGPGIDYSDLLVRENSLLSGKITSMKDVEGNLLQSIQQTLEAARVSKAAERLKKERMVSGSQAKITSAFSRLRLDEIPVGKWPAPYDAKEIRMSWIDIVQRYAIMGDPCAMFDPNHLRKVIVDARATYSNDNVLQFIHVLTASFSQATWKVVTPVGNSLSPLESGAIEALYQKEFTPCLSANENFEDLARSLDTAEVGWSKSYFRHSSSRFKEAYRFEVCMLDASQKCLIKFDDGETATLLLGPSGTEIKLTRFVDFETMTFMDLVQKAVSSAKSPNWEFLATPAKFGEGQLQSPAVWVPCPDSLSLERQYNEGEQIDIHNGTPVRRNSNETDGYIAAIFYQTMKSARTLGTVECYVEISDPSIFMTGDVMYLGIPVIVSKTSLRRDGSWSVRIVCRSEEGLLLGKSHRYHTSGVLMPHRYFEVRNVLASDEIELFEISESEAKDHVLSKGLALCQSFRTRAALIGASNALIDVTLNDVSYALDEEDMAFIPKLLTLYPNAKVKCGTISSDDTAALFSKNVLDVWNRLMYFDCLYSDSLSGAWMGKIERTRCAPYLNSIEGTQMIIPLPMSETSLEMVRELSNSLQMNKVVISDRSIQLFTTESVVPVTFSFTGRSNHFGNFAVHEAAKLKHLVSISLQNVPLLTPQGIAYLGPCPSLTYLSIAQNEHLRDTALETVCAHCCSLTELDVSDCTSFTSDAFKYLSKLSKLTTLQAARLPLVSTEGFDNIAACVSLSKLNISGCELCTDEAVKKLAKSLPHLVDFDLGNCLKVTSEAIHNLQQQGILIGC